MSPARSVALAVAALAASPVLAQQQIFRGGTDVVSLNITVTDNASHLVGGLPKDVFQVFEDGVLQDISFFSGDPQPIALSFLLDSSESMDTKLGVAQQAALGFVTRLTPTDIAEVVDFDSRVNVLQPFSSDHALLEHAILKTTAGGSTSMYNAVYIALTELKKVKVTSADQIRRQAIILLSDGEDTSSLVDYDQVLDQAKRSEVLVYTIGLRSKDDVKTKGFNEADFVMRTLAQETGGRVFFVEKTEDLPSVYQQIADELASQYTIGYSSKNPKHDGAFRTVIVRITKPGITARTKRGYYAPTIH
jgi:Ca-activated chloride channel family protein